MKELLEILDDVGNDNGFGIRPPDQWPDLKPNYDLSQLVKQARSLNQYERMIMAVGETSEIKHVVEYKNVKKLHDFLNDVFEGDLHQTIAI